MECIIDRIIYIIIVEIRKTRKEKQKKKLQDKETITRYSILQSILWFKNKNERYNNFKPWI